jgi:aminoglycoside 3-N-acetyltransferase I
LHAITPFVITGPDPVIALPSRADGRIKSGQDPGLRRGDEWREMVVLILRSSPTRQKAPVMTSPPFRVRQLGPDDAALMEAMMTVFGETFDDVETYTRARPRAHYMKRLLASRDFIALAALKDGLVVGGLAAYELHKFERERSEIYIYDLAVAREHRRQGIATALIDELKRIAARRGAYIIFVQADRHDAAAIALYTKLGKREDVLHFDIAIT